MALARGQAARRRARCWRRTSRCATSARARTPSREKLEHHRVQAARTRSSLDPEMCLLAQGLRLPGAGHARRLRRACASAATCPAPAASARPSRVQRPRRQGPVGDRLARRRRATRPRSTTLARADPRPGRHLLPLQPAGLAAAPARRSNWRARLGGDRRHEPQITDRSHHPPRGPRQDRHLPRRAGRRRARLLPGPRAARLREVRRRAARPRTCRRSPRASAASARRRTTWPRPRRSTTSTRSTRRRPRKKIRELVYNTFMVEDHALHFYFLGGPDFVVGPDGAGGRAQHPRRHRQGRPRGRARRSSPCAQAAARAHRADVGGKVDPSGLRPARRRVASRSRPRSWRSSSRRPRDAVEFAQFTLQVFRRRRAGEPGVRRPHHLRRLHPPHLLHGPGGREEPGELLRRQAPRGRPRRARSSRKFDAAGVPRLRRRARRAVELHQVLLPEAARLERLRRRRRERRLRRRAAGAAERRRRHGHAAGAGGVRGVLRDARRQAGAPHAGQPLGAGRRAALRRRAA